MLGTIASASKRFELLRTRLKADEAGQTLLEYLQAQILSAESVRELGVSSVTHGQNSTSFFSSGTSGSLGIDDRAELLERFYTICEAAVTALGGSPTNAEVYAQMLEDDYFHGVTSYSTSFTDLRTV